MSLNMGSQFSVISLLDRAIGALAVADTPVLTEILADCHRAELPCSQEEFSRALTQQAVFEKALELTVQNIRLFRGEQNSFSYGRNRGRNS